MYLGIALSKIYPEHSIPSSVPKSEFCQAMEVLEFAEYLPISTKWLKQIQEATSTDCTLLAPKRMNTHGVA